jgi:hypothetical protein
MTAIVSPRFDWIWFAGPGLVSAAIAIAIGLFGGDSAPLGLLAWLVLVLAIDVAHVWSTLARTYLDPGARIRHRKRLLVIPALVAWFGFLLHLESPAAFWTVLAYIAIFHFIMQFVGFAMIYARKGGESAFDRRLVKVAVWAGTAAPIVWWHANLPREFAWFMENDLVGGLPAPIGTLALVVEIVVLAVFAARRLQLRRNPLLVAMVLVPALNWYLGIVAFDDDRIFTVTNVVMHGVPYVALVWIAGGRRQIARLTKRDPTGPWSLVALYAGVLVVVAVLEEGLWDRLVWHDRSEVFGAPIELEHPVLTAMAVAVLTVPQATHYLLDRWIWRAGPDNPELADDLGLR